MKPLLFAKRAKGDCWRAFGIRESGGYYGCHSRIRVMVIGEANDAFGNNAA